MFRLADIDRDEDSIIELHSLCFDYKTQMAPLLFALDDDRVFVILYGEEEEPSGYIVCRITDEKSTLLWIGVRPEHRGKGWGRILTSVALDESRSRGAEYMELNVSEDNASAIQLYKSLGFIYVGNDEGFYADVEVGSNDAIIMRVSLIKKEIQENESKGDEPYLAEMDRDRDAITALHSVCKWNPAERAELQIALDDENCFTILIGSYDQPAGYSVVRIQDKEAHGLWSGIRPERRGEGRYRKLQLAALNESRARGAEIWDAYIAEENPDVARTLQTHKNLGCLIVDSSPDSSIISKNNDRIAITNHYIATSLMTIADRKEYDDKTFGCDGEGTHPKVYFKYTPKYSNVRRLKDGKLTAVCPYCDKDVIHNG